MYGRVATALGCLPSAIDDEPVSNIFELLQYWVDEPPTHVTLATRYFGESKGRSGGLSRQSAEESAAATAQNIGVISQQFGMPINKMSERTKKLYEYAQSVLAPKGGKADASQS